MEFDTRLDFFSKKKQHSRIVVRKPSLRYLTFDIFSSHLVKRMTEKDLQKKILHYRIGELQRQTFRVKENRRCLFH